MVLHFLIKFLETIFCIGMVGSLVVAVLAFVGDIHVFFDKDEEPAFTKKKNRPAPTSIPDHTASAL